MTSTALQHRTVVVEREMLCSAEKLWRALTQPHLMEVWLMKNNFVPEIGHSFHLTGDWGGTLDCEVLELEPPTKLSYTWNFAHVDEAYRLNSVVVFTLTPTSAGTHLRVEQSGFGPEQKQAYGGAQAGWKDMLGKLGDVVSQTK